MLGGDVEVLGMRMPPMFMDTLLVAAVLGRVVALVMLRVGPGYGLRRVRRARPACSEGEGEDDG